MGLAEKLKAAGEMPKVGKDELDRIWNHAKLGVVLMVEAELLCLMTDCPPGEEWVRIRALMRKLRDDVRAGRR